MPEIELTAKMYQVMGQYGKRGEIFPQMLSRMHEKYFFWEEVAGTIGVGLSALRRWRRVFGISSPQKVKAAKTAFIQAVSAKTKAKHREQVLGDNPAESLFAMRLAGLRHEEIGREIGVHPSTVGRWMLEFVGDTGSGFIRKENMETVQRALDVDLLIALPPNQLAVIKARYLDLNGRIPSFADLVDQGLINSIKTRAGMQLLERKALDNLESWLI